MADFCKQCSLDIFGEDYRELADISTPEQTTRGYYAVVLCEDCGPTRVDHDGLCVANCIKAHGDRLKG